MSKKHKKHFGQMFQTSAGQPAASQHQAEYNIIKVDLIKVVILNVVYLVALLGLYYANKSSHVVDNFFAKIFHF